MTRRLLYAAIVALTAAVLSIAIAAIARAEDAPRLYLPLVQHLRMSSEYTPVQPAPVVTPEVPVTGDVQ